MLYKSTSLRLIFLSLLCFGGNFSLGQFNSKQLTTDISDQMLDLDLNNDGQVDIISIGYDSIDGHPNHLYYFENNSGVFLDPVQIGNTPLEKNIQLKKADINNDGFSDVIYLDKTAGAVSVYQNLQNGSLSAPIQIISQFPEIDVVEFADIDNDNQIDIVLSSLFTDEIVWFKNQGMFAFGNAQTIVALNPGNYTIRFTLTDYDSDGDKDLFYISQMTQQLMFTINLGSAVFDSPAVIDFYISLSNSYAPILNHMDINQDGTDDLVVNMLASDDNILWYEFVSGIISPRHELSPIGMSTLYHPLFTIYEDLNGDGYNELILADWNDIKYFPNNAGTISSNPVTLISNLPSYITNISIRDYNSDNNPDIVVNDANTGIQCYSNNTNFSFGLVQTLSPEIIRPDYVISSDLDSDGLTDIVFLKNSSRELNWMKNLGNDNFGPPQVFFTVPIAPLYLTPDVKEFQLADLDNDGIHDLVTLKGIGSSGYIEYFKGTGNMVFAASTGISATSLDVLSFRIADLENDNDLDIIYYSYYDNQVGFYENLGAGAFSAAQIIDNTCDNPYVITVSDLDNDSDLDVISVSVGDNKMKAHINTGNNMFATPVVISSQLSANSYQIFSEDADTDGLSDIILSTHGGNKVSWFKNTGNGTFSGENIITTGMNLPNIQPFDYDDDGDPDILCKSSFDPKGTYLLENLGNGNFLPMGPKIMNILFADATFNDFDNDGDLDIVSSAENRLFYSENLHNKTVIEGKIFCDLNNNGALDSSDVGMTVVGIGTNPAASYVFSDNVGNYRISFYDSSQAYTVYTQLLPNWDLTTDSSTYTVFVGPVLSEIDSLNFGFYPAVVADSISAQLIGGLPRCNDTINYWLNVRNHGTSIPSGVISLDLDTNLIYVSANPLPDSVSNGIYYWNYEDLFYFNDTAIKIHVATPDFTFSGEEFVSGSEVTVLDNLGNVVYVTQDTLRQTLVCAYDPNDKSSEPNGIGYHGYVNQLNEIEYLIRFQNTGTDTAKLIVIRDQLDPHLDWSSLRPVSGSHDFNVTVDTSGLVTFTFSDIYLPDSNVNELASHGYVSYRINANENLPAGTVVSNHAEIYFDENPAVLTNYKVLTLFNCESLFAGAPQSNDIFCANDSIQFGIDYPETHYEWQSLSPSSTDDGAQVTIHPQTIGMNSYTVYAENAICSLDSVVSFNVSSVSVFSEGEVEICEGDSIMIYNVYQSLAGIYSDTLQNQFGCDSVVVKELIVETCLGTKELTYNSPKIYPNPTEGKIYADFVQPFNGVIIIRDITGKDCFVQKYVNKQNLEIWLAGQTGIYFLEIREAGKVKRIYKLVKY